MAEETDGLVNFLKDQFRRLDARFEAADRRLAAFEERVDDRLTVIEQRMTALEARA